MNLYLFFIFAFPQNADTTNTLPEHYHLYTFSTYERCYGIRKKTLLEYSAKRLPYQVEFTLCQKVEREPLII